MQGWLEWVRQTVLPAVMSPEEARGPWGFADVNYWQLTAGLGKKGKHREYPRHELVLFTPQRVLFIKQEADGGIFSSATKVDTTVYAVPWSAVRELYVPSATREQRYLNLIIPSPKGRGEMALYLRFGGAAEVSGHAEQAAFYEGALAYAEERVAASRGAAHGDGATLRPLGQTFTYLLPQKALAPADQAPAGGKRALGVMLLLVALGLFGFAAMLAAMVAERFGSDMTPGQIQRIVMMLGSALLGLFVARFGFRLSRRSTSARTAAAQ